MATGGKVLHHLKRMLPDKRNTVMIVGYAAEGTRARDLAHGARAVLRVALQLAERAPDRLTRLQQWAVSIATHRGRHKAVIAVANKLARMVWAVWHYDVAFEPQPRVA